MKKKSTAVLITLWVMCIINVLIFRYYEIPEGTFTMMSICLPVPILFEIFWKEEENEKEQ